jgi:hypothetical protein
MKYATYKIRFPQGDTPELLIQEQGIEVKNLLISRDGEVLAELSENCETLNLRPWGFRIITNEEAFVFAVALDSRITKNEEGFLVFPPKIDPLSKIGGAK